MFHFLFTATRLMIGYFERSELLILVLIFTGLSLEKILIFADLSVEKNKHIFCCSKLHYCVSVLGITVLI